MVNKKGNVFEELGIKQISIPRKKTVKEMTAQEIIEETGTGLGPKASEELLRKAREGIKKERIEKFKSAFRRPQPVSRGVRRLDVKASEKARKAIHLVAPKKSIVRKLTAPPGKKVKGRGRGRPSGTYKARVLPSGRVVKVPTHIYKKMLSQEKATMRLATAQKQAQMRQLMEAEQIAAQTDPRYQQQDPFLQEPDMEHEQRLADIKQQLQQQQYLQQMQQQVQQEQQPGVATRAGEMFSRARISLMGTDRRLQGQLQGQGGGEDLMSSPRPPQIHRPPVQPIQRPQVDEFGRHTSPQVLVTKDKSPMFSQSGPSILSQPNEFNRPGGATLL